MAAKPVFASSTKLLVLALQSPTGFCILTYLMTFIARVLPCRLLSLQETSSLKKMGCLKLKEIQQLGPLCHCKYGYSWHRFWAGTPPGTYQCHQWPNKHQWLFLLYHYLKKMRENEGKVRRCLLKKSIQAISFHLPFKIWIVLNLTTLSRARALPQAVCNSHERPRPLSSMPTISTRGSLR